MRDGKESGGFGVRRWVEEKVEESAAESGEWNGSAARPPLLRYKSSTVSMPGGGVGEDALALFEDREGGHSPLLANYLSAFTMPGPAEIEKNEAKHKKAEMGTMIGVYLPTIQHIFGVLMFLRLFWIVGSMGILQSLFMVTICCLCTFLTSISMSAIATNGVVESGGSYFMISRNLGPEFGTAVGVLFYLANTVATAMYLVGGVEIALDNEKLASHYCKPNSTSMSGESCLPAWEENSFRCLESMPGFASGVFMENMGSTYMKVGETLPGVKAKKEMEVFQDYKTSFFKLLAIYFPSVTGIMTGSNMSGDLRDPQKSIPSGTIAAQLTTTFVYISFVLVFGGTIEGALLRDKYGNSLGSGMVVAELAWPSKWIMLIGSFTSTFGAALQCICSAPRLLQAIAKDDVIPFLRPFSVVDSRNEPIRGLIISAFIAELAILIGAVDYIAPVVDLFFLMCYAFVNFVCALHSLLGAPNWRPRFRFYHWTLSLLGAFLCLFIMFATYWYYALVAVALCAVIYKYVEFKGAKKEWGDGMRGLALTTAQYSLLKIEDKDPHPKNWRPQILILMKLTGDLKPQYRKMFELASQLKAGRGLTMVASLMQGDPNDVEERKKAEDSKESLRSEMQNSKLRGFAKTVLYEEGHMASSISTLVQTAGIGGLRPNTVMVGWPTAWKDASANNSEYWDFMDKIHRGASQDMCLIVPKGIQDFPGREQRLSGSIDVWWILHDGGLLILLSFLLNQHKVWKGCHLRLFAVARPEDNSIQMKKDMEAFLYQLRIPGTVEVVELTEPEISAYAYERTMMMEERSQLIRDLHLSDKERAQLFGEGPPPARSLPKRTQSLTKRLPQLLVEKHRGMGRRGSESSAPRPTHPLIPLNPVSPDYQSPPGTFQGPAADSLSPDAFSSPEHSLPQSPDSPNTLSVPEAERPCSQQEESAPSSSGEELDEPPYSEGRDRLTSLHKSEQNASHRKYQYTFTPAEGAKLSAPTISVSKLDKRKVKKMHTAVRLNSHIKELSADAQLVVLNLPRPPRSRMALTNYCEYLEALTDELPRVLLVSPPSLIPPFPYTLKRA